MIHFEEQFSMIDVEGQSIYKLWSAIDNELVALHEDVLNNIFIDIDYYAIVGLCPRFMRDGGLSGESAINQATFEKWVKRNDNYLTNKFLYYHDVESLVSSVQNRFSIIAEMLDRLFVKISPRLPVNLLSCDGVLHSRDVEIHSILNSIIINVSSCCDILTKLAFELENINSIKFDKYPKLYSKDILYVASKRLPETLKVDGSIFAPTRPKVIQQFDSLRNEIVHNGSLDFDYRVYYGQKEENYYTWVMIPDFDSRGLFTTYNNRKKFYSDSNKTFNTELPLMIKNFFRLSKTTILNLRQNYSHERYESQTDVEKYIKDIINWYQSYSNILCGKGDVTGVTKELSANNNSPSK